MQRALSQISLLCFTYPNIDYTIRIFFMNIVKWKQSETSIFQYKSCRLHACFRPLSSIPNPSLALSLSLFVSLPPARPTYAKGKAQYEYRTYIRYLLYIFCLLGGLRTVNKIFQLGCLFQDLLCMCVCVCVREWDNQSACSCTAERKEARERDRERERTTYRKLFILFLCFNLYLIQFWFSLFFCFCSPAKI